MCKQSDIEAWMFENKDSIAAHIAKGFAQAEQGELINGDVSFEILRQRRSRRLNKKSALQ